MPMNTCPREQELTAYILGKLEEDLAAEVGEHVEHCADCQGRIVRLSASADQLVSVLREAGRTTPPPDPPEVQQILARVEESLATRSTLADAEKTETIVVRPGGDPCRLGQYEILGTLGTGGMGRVYKAVHPRLNRTVALKVLPGELMQDAHALARFRREIQAVGQLDHPNIVRATDAGEADGIHYLVMELLAGLDLSSLVKQFGPLPIADACEAIRQAAMGLQHAHERGLIHRDIKPSNLILTGNGTVKVVDFGLALLSGSRMAGEELTATEQVMGTVDYVAPEQVQDSHAVDQRADIYSLGCTLFKLLTEKAPFSGPEFSTPFKKMMAHVHTPPPPLRGLRQEVPPALAIVVARMMAKDPALRPATAREVVAALEAFCAGSDLPALLGRVGQQTVPSAEKAVVEIHPTPKPVSGVSRETRPGVGEQAQPAVRRPWRRWTLVGAASCGAVLILLSILLTVKDKKGNLVGQIVLPDGASAVVSQGKDNHAEVEVQLPAGQTGRSAAESARPLGLASLPLPPRLLSPASGAVLSNGSRPGGATRVRRILVDASRDGGVWWYPQVPPQFDPGKPHQGKQAADYLAQHGWVVDEVGRGASDISARLKNADVVLYIGAQPPADDGAAMYRAWIAQGGVMLMHVAFRSEDHAAQFADAFGLRVQGAFCETQIVRWTLDRSANPPHSPAKLSTTPLSIASSSPWDWVVRQGNSPTTGELIVGTTTMGKGKVVFVSSQFLFRGVVQPFTDRLFEHLSGVGSSESREWQFQWSPVAGASLYHLYVIGPGAIIPLIDGPPLTETSYTEFVTGYVAEHNRLGWRWKVRARVGAVWTDWSEERTFDVEPLKSIALLRSTATGIPSAPKASSGRSLPMLQAGYVICCPDSQRRKPLMTILAGKDKVCRVEAAATLEDALRSTAEVAVLWLPRGPIRKGGEAIIERLKERKVIGIGYGAAELFERIGLEICAGHCAHGFQDAKITLEKSGLLPKPRLIEPFTPVVGLPGEGKQTSSDVFALYLPRRSPTGEFVDVLARWSSSARPDVEDYAPLARQGNHVLVGLDLPPSLWTSEFKETFLDVVVALHDRARQPFRSADWGITPPGRYSFHLAEGRNTSELYEKSFHFRFATPTTFSARLTHAGSHAVMMLFMGDQRRHWTRRDAAGGESLAISEGITADDIRQAGETYWSLKVTNFDRNSAVDCTLIIDYALSLRRAMRRLLPSRGEDRLFMMRCHANARVFPVSANPNRDFSLQRCS